ncbi:Na+/H+ antiporter subunit E [Carnimonas bestiolae]|uniref:Na+/H+ antiporter subunit E n=1 Tax=Carnimonas bestiolae TaxID=3402172 RepID=UPI003EDBC8D9
MKRFFGWLITHPFISSLVFVMWVLMNTLSVGNTVMALVVALLIPKLIDGFWVPQPKLHKPWKLVMFLIHVIYDIVEANIQVAKNIWLPKHAPRPAFIFYPLAMQESFPITLLTSTISLSPGTLSAHLRPHDNTLLIHALDVEDPDQLVNFIYERYERPLKEIFGC